MQAIIEMKKPAGKILRILSLILVLVFALSACGLAETFREIDEKPLADRVFRGRRPKTTLSIVSGSENRILEPLLETFAEDYHYTVEITYMGSLEIMQLLQDERIPFDAVWPASSLWISVGDTKHRVKHLESTSSTPVIFGIRESVAEDLGFIGRDVYVRDILDAIQNKNLRFTMTSATQSNSGASAYIGFIYALLGSPSKIDKAALADPDFQQDMRELLLGVERSSGSSDWLKDLYLQGDYDAMVNYEALIIDANRELEREGRETLHAIYPVDGMMIANSPLGFVSDNGDEKRDEALQEEAFLELQSYLLSEDVQKAIQRTGRRTGVAGVAKENLDVFREDWGIDTERVLSTINMPQKDVLLEALNLYQKNFKKPGYNIYVLDFSGSMAGQGREQLIAALGEVMLQDRATQNFIQATDDEINIFIPFGSNVRDVYEVKGGGEALEKMHPQLAELRARGGTALYEALEVALDYAKQADLETHSPSIILMTDGMPNGKLSFVGFEESYQALGRDVPVFSILFGDANEFQMDRIAELTRARVFDGRHDLGAAFRSVKGYN